MREHAYWLSHHLPVVRTYIHGIRDQRYLGTNLSSDVGRAYQRSMERYQTLVLVKH